MSFGSLVLDKENHVHFNLDWPRMSILVKLIQMILIEDVTYITSCGSSMMAQQHCSVF